MARTKNPNAVGTAAVEEALVKLSRVNIEEMTVRVVGTSPLVVHRMGS